MKKLLLLFLLLPFLGFAQVDVDLANWSLISNGDVTAKRNFIEASTFRTSQNPITFNSTGANITGWNNSNFEHYRYFEVSIAPTNGNFIKISNLFFQQTNSGSAGPLTYIAKYYISENGNLPDTSEFFNKAEDLISEESINNNPIKEVKINQYLNPKQKLTVRFYSKGNDYNNIYWQILANTLKVTGYQITKPLEGNYIIGSADNCDFPNITSAINVLNNVGVSGSVTFLLNENQTVTSQITINQFSETVKKDNNTLTIKPNFGKEILISGKIGNGAVIALNGADKVIIDGNNGFNDHKLTIYNSYDVFGSYEKRVGIWMYNGAENNKFQNLIVQLNILGVTVGTYSAGIYSGGNSIGGNGNNSYNSILNTTFKDVKQAIIIDGSNLENTNWIIKNNIIGSSDDNRKPFLGIYIRNVSYYNVSNNVIDGIQLPSGLGGSSNHSGIYLDNAEKGAITKNVTANIRNSAGNSYGYGIFIKGKISQIDGNIIKDLNSNSTNEGSYGIRSEGNDITIYNNDISNVFSSQSKNTNGIYVSGDNQLIYNNFINDVKSAGGGGTDSENGFGVFINKGKGVKLYYNTVALKTNQNKGVSAALFIKDGSELDIRNNIFVNHQSGGAQRFAIYSKVTNSGNFIHLDYNNYYSSQYVGSLGEGDANRHSTLADWIKATKKDSNSKNSQPAFVSSDDLHLKSGSANDNLQGVSISGISTDIDGEFRVKPYMGADEIVCVLPTVSAGGSFKICTGSTTPPMGGSVTGGLSAQWTGGTGTWTNADDPARATYTAGPGESGLVTLTLTSTGSCGSVSSTATVTIGAISTYNGTEWTNGNPNTENNGLSIIIASGTYKTSHDNNIIACSCEVKSGASLVISSGTFAKIDNNLTIKDGGNITVESDGNLIQVQDYPTPSNSGIITVKRDIKVSGNRQQYNYLGSPVAFTADQSFKTIYPGTTFVLYHNEANNLFYNSSGANVPGRGLAVKEPTGKGEETVTAVYKGSPQNGVIEFGMINGNVSNPNRGYNLLGNPYPSNIDLKKLYKINGGDERKNIDANFYFWDNTANEIFDQKGDNYEGEAYAIFNVLAGTNGTGTKAATVGKGHVPTNYVKVGQGFMGRSLKASYKLIYNNSIRIDSEPPVDFFGKNSTASQDDRYWLQMTTPSGIISTMAIVHYAEGNDLFGLEDSRTMGGSDGIYSIIDNEKLAIDGRSSFQNSAVIPLGTQHFINGNYTIGIEGSEGIFANGQPIYLKDKQTGTVTNVTEGDYAFAANAGSSTGRFEIIYRPETVLVTDTKVKEGIVVYRDGNDFVIKGPKTIASIEVYDPSGKLVTILQPNSKQGVLDSSKLIRGMYLLKITSADGEVTSKKIIK
ncbi:MAG: T9SS type A sorting domain-containing protein [Flavobacteriales bacterium]|nr:T9SS type A sorting domain-containing protein [Flavobacteriales bacterium]